MKMERSLLIRHALVILSLCLATSAFAGGSNGFALSGSVGGAGGGQVTTSSGSPAVAWGVEVGAHLDKRGFFVGLFEDQFTSSIWQAGITARKFSGPYRLFWYQIKVSLSGVAGAIGDSAHVKTWDNYLNGGLAAGLRIPVKRSVSLQPFVEFDSFLPVTGTRRVSTGPGESKVELVTGPRCYVPMAGIRLAFEF